MTKIEELKERIELLTKALKKSEKKAEGLQRKVDMVRAVIGNE